MPNSGYMPIDYGESLLCYYNNNNELLLMNGNSCNISNYSIADIAFFNNNRFNFSHFLVNDTTIENPDSDTDAMFLTVQGNTNNDLEFTYNGLCGNGTNATILLNNDRSMTVLNRGGTTLTACNATLHPLGDAQEDLFFNILTGNYYLQENNPLPVYYEESADGLTLAIWNFENEKLIFNIEERLAISDFNFKNSFKFYPNPVKNSFTISSTFNNYNIEVFSVLGRKLIEKQHLSLNTTLDLIDLSKGIYFIQISNQLDKFSIKIVKE